MNKFKNKRIQNKSSNKDLSTEEAKKKINQYIDSKMPEIINEVKLIESKLITPEYKKKNIKSFRRRIQ